MRGFPRCATPGAPVMGHDAVGGIKISHVTGARRCVPQAGCHQPGGRGRGGSRGRASSGVLLAHRVQTLLSVGRAGGRSPHNHGAAAPAGSRGEPGTAEMLGLARQRGSARLSNGAKPARAWPLPAAWVSGTTPPPPSASQAVLLPRPTPVPFSQPICLANFISLAFHMGKLRQEAKPPCPRLSRGRLGAAAGCNSGLLVGEEEEEGLPEPPPAVLPSCVGPARLN